RWRLPLLSRWLIPLQGGRQQSGFAMGSLIPQARRESRAELKPTAIEFMFRYADGRRLTGSYYEYDGIVRVTTTHGTKATQLGGSPRGFACASAGERAGR